MTSADDGTVDQTPLPVLRPVFHHVNLKTNRLEEIIEWYSIVIGSHVTFSRHDIAFITNDSANHRIALLAVEEYVEPDNRDSHVGMHHTAFEYPSLDELLQTWVRLGRLGIRPTFTLDHGPTTSFYYRDPDGNFVELQADNWDNASQSAVFMHEDPRFAEDPIGRSIDPQRMLDAREAGKSPWEIHVAGYDGQLAPPSTDANNAS